MPSTLVIPESVAAIFAPRTVRTSESAAFIPVVMHAFMSVSKTVLVAEENPQPDCAVDQF